MLSSMRVPAAAIAAVIGLLIGPTQPALAEDSAGGRMISILEGGYDLKALATASRAHAGALVTAG